MNTLEQWFEQHSPVYLYLEKPRHANWGVALVGHEFDGPATQAIKKLVCDTSSYGIARLNWARPVIKCDDMYYLFIEFATYNQSAMLEAAIKLANAAHLELEIHGECG